MMFIKKKNKISFLQLALALTYLYMDYNNNSNRREQNLEQNVRFGQVRDNVWGLELLYSLPTATYYVNQKAINPHIDELIHYGRHFEIQYNISAYLVNLPTNPSSSSNSRITHEEGRQISNISSENCIREELLNYFHRTDYEVSNANNSASTGLNATDNNTSSNSLLYRLNLIDATNPSDPFDILFYGNDSSNGYDERTILEQNLADLNDFNDLPLMDNYVQEMFFNNAEIGNEIINNARNNGEETADYEIDLHLDNCLPNYNNFPLRRTELSSVTTNESNPIPNNNVEIKMECNDKDIYMTINSTDDNISWEKFNSDVFGQDINHSDSRIDVTPNSNTPAYNRSNNCCFIGEVELSKEVIYNRNR